MSRRCIAVLGGSFDPVHDGHVALAAHLVNAVAPDELRLLPAGDPWQKGRLHAGAADRVAMLKIAFQGFPLPVTIDTREIDDGAPTYTIDTLRALRAESGDDVSIAFLIGADQLRGLNTWKEWTRLFDYANFCVATRPGFAIASADLPEEVRRELDARQCPPAQIRQQARGAICIAEGLAVDASSTQARNAIKNALRDGKPLNTPLPGGVLDYIKRHHLYGT